MEGEVYENGETYDVSRCKETQNIGLPKMRLRTERSFDANWQIRICDSDEPASPDSNFCIRIEALQTEALQHSSRAHETA